MSHYHVNSNVVPNHGYKRICGNKILFSQTEFYIPPRYRIKTIHINTNLWQIAINYAALDKHSRLHYLPRDIIDYYIKPLVGEHSWYKHTELALNSPLTDTYYNDFQYKIISICQLDRASLICLACKRYNQLSDSTQLARMRDIIHLFIDQLHHPNIPQVFENLHDIVSTNDCELIDHYINCIDYEYHYSQLLKTVIDLTTDAFIKKYYETYLEMILVRYPHLRHRFSG